MTRCFLFVAVVVCGGSVSMEAHAQRQRSPQQRVVPQSLPDLDKLSFSKPDQDGWITVTGRAAAVSPGATVYVQCLETGALFRTDADENGGFVRRVPAPSGSTLVINYGARGIPRWKDGGPALEITVNSPVSDTEETIRFTVAGEDGQGTGYWIGKGVQNGVQFKRGGRLKVSIAFTYYAPELPAKLDPRRVPAPELQLCRLSDAQGQVVQHSFVPTVMTPTGLPIFSEGGSRGNRINVRPQIDGVKQVGNTLSLTARYSLSIDEAEAFAAGHYFGRIRWRPAGVWPRGTGPKSRGNENDVTAFLQGGSAQNVLPVFRIGDAKPPRLPWMLLANTLSNGTRGAVAREDKGKFALGDKVLFHADRLIVPRDDPRTGRRKIYRLEPFLPTIGYAVGGADRPTPPIVKFSFPTGELRVSVTRPNGNVDRLGVRRFRAARAKMPGIEQQRFGSGSIRSIYQLTTLDDAFDYRFAEFGRYVVHMSGSIKDAYGTVYAGGGTYDVYVARTLDLDLGTFLSTPFEVGDAMSPTVHVRPGLPADVQIVLRHYPNSQTEQEIRRTISGRANRFGYFHPGMNSQLLKLTAPGEYVVDVSASYTDSDGVLWMGALRGASVVETPNPKLIAHGKRGITHVSPRPDSFPLWYSAASIDPPGFSGEDRGKTVQMFIPYMSGDVVWAADGTNSAIAPVLTIDDPLNITRWRRPNRRDPRPKNTNRQRPNPRDGNRRNDGPSAGVIGELPVQLPGVTSKKLSAVQYPELIKIWSYYYFSVQRPGVTVRSFVGSGSVGRAYWGFGDVYNWQLGNGRDGDLPGDVKLQYGGVVYRDTARGVNQYAIYGSMAVMIAKGTQRGQRVFPPFQGAAGGPVGGPLLTLKGKEIDIFVTPTGVVPGAVLETGDTFSFSGAVWPTLGSLVDVTVTMPSGKTINTRGRANRIGHFHRPTDDFVVDEPGTYTVRVRVTHDGDTSAGPVEEPYPIGSVLGAAEGRFRFYVVPKDKPTLLQVDTPPLGLRLSHDAGRHPRRGLTIAARVPDGVREPRAWVSVNCGGTVIAEGPLKISDGRFLYTYDLHELRKTFTNLDQEPSDTVAITLCVTGKNVVGERTAAARQILLQGRDVYAPE